MTTHLSSAPEAKRAPFGENLATFVLSLASLKPYKIFIETTNFRRFSQL